MDGGGFLLALSKVMVCYSFESSEIRCASEFDPSYVVLETHTAVIGGCYCDVICIGYDFRVLRSGCWDVVENKIKRYGG